MNTSHTGNLQSRQAIAQQSFWHRLWHAIPRPGEQMQMCSWLALPTLLGATLLLLVVANLFSLRLQGSSYTLNVGFRADRHMLTGVFSQEEDTTGTRYRWTREESSFLVRGFAATERAFIRLHMGWLPPTVQEPRLVHLAVDGAEWFTMPVSADPRRYTILLPPDALRDGDMTLNLSSETTRVPPDRRDIGIRLDRIEVGWPTSVWVLPTWQALLVQWLMVISAMAIAARLELPSRAIVALALGTILLLSWSIGQNLFIAAVWHNSLLVASVAILLLVWGTYPRLTRLLPGEGARAELRWLLLITLVILGIRLLAALYPIFDSHDWYIHQDRLFKLQHGSILLYDKPAEFSTRLAIVPPALYIIVAPLTLLTTNTVLTIQGLYAFIDGCASLLLALFVRQLGGSRRAALLAAIVLALLPIQYTALWWGFGPQVFGQVLILLLALFVMQHRIDTPMLWLVAGVVFCLILLMHIGTGLLGGFWLAGYVALTWCFHRSQPYWKQWGTGLIIVGIAVTALLYSQVIAMHLHGLESNQRLAWTEDDHFRVQWTLGSLYFSFRPIGMSFHPDAWNSGWLPGLLLTLFVNTLVIISIVFLVYRARGTHRLLVLAWLASSLLFFGVDLAFGLQIRYAYFAIPMICAGFALLLDRLIARHRLGWLVAGCLVGIIGWMGLKLWFDGVVLASKPSLRALTH